MRRALAAFLPGMLAGAGLAVAGMTNPAKVQGFLDVTGSWDPTLAMVMAGALSAFFVGTRLARRRAAPFAGGSFPGPPRQPLDARVVGGAALFGVGWGLAGFCPGPAVTNLGALRAEALWFVPAMLVGMGLARVGFGVDRAAVARPTAID